jgi:DNA-binding MarR family transcriptional regulator
MNSKLHRVKQNKSRPEELVVALFRTNDAIQWRIQKLLKHYGLSVEQYNAMKILLTTGVAGLPISKIGERMLTRKPAMTRMLDKLESKGFLRRQERSTDRRKIICCLTVTGKALMNELEAPMLRIISQSTSMLTPAELQKLENLLTAIRKGLTTT